ncbi:PREDICTED: transcriptional regulator ATRX homolog isoform X1 [Trachymyrmex cornetzi]|uniref:transcriptional regulator ATRX homolog isoform X1 n=1 Tax=Trachymyrmex cornetzi TaxID=471704 RepID=UPI00084F5628|nr:PREDICTED: transcriptional regulator ATRX homolog isoform X1 [Trachymyrmex cornetzi]
MSWKKIIKPTSKELAFREKHFHDIRIIKDRQIKCTACGNELNIQTNRIFSHPFIGILQCEICWNELKNIQTRFDEDKARHYCHICGIYNNRKLYECCNKNCNSAFCKGCIKRNVSLSLLDVEKDDWECFICNPKPLWDLRAICAAVIDSLSTKSNKGRSNKIEKKILPSQIQRINETKYVQNLLDSMCDREDNDSSEESFVSARFARKNRHTNYEVNSLQKKKKNALDITDSSSEDSFCKRKNLSILSKRNNQNKNESDQKTKCVGDFYSARKVSIIKEKKMSKKNKISSDSSDDSSDVSSNKIRRQRIIKHNRSKKIIKSKTNVYSSDSESDENNTDTASNVSKRISKGTRQQNKKMDNSHNTRSRDKAKKNNSTGESEDEKYIKRNTRKRSETSQLMSHSNDERKRDKSSKQRLSNIQEDNSDNSSSKEFQKIKLQKVNRNIRQLANLEVDHTKTPKNSTNNSDKDINGQSNKKNLLDMKKILMDCKKACSDFQMHIESIEHLYGKEDEEKLVLKSTEKIDRLRMILEKKHKNLLTSYQVWSRNRKKSATKRSNKVVTDSEQSEEKRDNCIEDEDKHVFDDKQDGNKDVSECDSEEIFSADETRSPQKMQAARCKVDLARTEKSLNNNETDTDDEDRMSINKSKINNDKNNVDVQDDSTTSPTLRLKEKNISIERSSEKQLSSEYNKNNNETQSSDENETEIEDSPSKSSSKKMVLENDETNRLKKNIIDESMDMFDTSPEDAEKNRTEVETNCDKEELLQTSKDKLLDPCENSLQNKISDQKERTFLEEEEDLSNQSNQEKMAAISVTNKEVYDSKASRKMNIDDNESLDDAEALAKEALLADSDTSDTSNKNVAKLTEVSTDDETTNRIEKKNELEDIDSDVNSVSTIKLSTLKKNANTDAEKDVITEAEIKAEKKSNDQSDERSRKEMSSSEDENIKKEKAAKKALLESDDSIPLRESRESVDSFKKFESDSSKKNAEAKRLLLASSSEDSSSELTLSEMINVSKNIKRNREPETDREHNVSRLKKRRLKLNENYYYKNDKKLRMSCKVHLERLSTEILKRYSHALKKSREYLEHKEFKSLVNLDKLEKNHKKNIKKDSDSSMDNDSSSKISKRSNKKENTKIKEESLMDHLKKIENGDTVATVETDLYTEDQSIYQKQNVDDTISNDALISEADRLAKENLLNSSDSDEEEVILDSDSSIKNDDTNGKKENKKKQYQKKSEEQTSKNDNEKDKSAWRRDKILTMKLSDSDSDAEREKWENKQEKLANKSKNNNSDSGEEKSFKSKRKKKKTGRRIIDSDSDIKITDVDSDNSSNTSSPFITLYSNDSDDTRKEKEQLKRNKRRKRGDSSGTDSSLSEKKSKPKRKRIKKMASDSDSSDVEMLNSQESSPGKSGRKNIRKVLKDKQVTDDTKQAAKEEEERLKRIAERQAVYNEMFEIRLAGEEKVDKLVLDFDTETKQELVTVHKELVKHLKPHQAQGIKFMWDACFESLERVKSTSGSGCIIAHCMGLGKTLQVITLTHTLLTHEATNVKTVLVVCPLSTVLNWRNEYNTWLKDLDDFEVYELTKFKKNFERKYQLQRWQKTGGVMIIGYEMFRNLTSPNRNIRKAMKEVMLECLVDPGADLVVCDEGHLLKNEDTALSKCMRNVKTLRRIVLTGTPLQNNLIEYHCMVQFAKPNLLGTKKEFSNRFVNPITNGQFHDSTAYDVKLMKKRAHVLHKMLEGSVQRFDYSVLTPFLPPKQEYVIFVRLTDIQVKLYQYYLENVARRLSGQGRTLFADFQALQRIWTHPLVLRLNAEKIEKANEKKELSDSEGSLKDFIDDDTDVESSSSSSNSNDSNNDSDVQAIDEKDNANVPKRNTRNNPVEEEPMEQIKETSESEVATEWWLQFVQSEHFEDMRESAKLLLLFAILKESEQIGDKVLVFSQSLYSLTLIEEFLRRIDDQTQKDESCDTLDNHTGSWSLGLDYFRLDGQTSPENRNLWCKIFNRPTNIRARLFLISTRAGGLGINLTAANRVIIFDASWNPSHDVQSIFRIYRFGQKKPCYVYRFLAAGTMEEKIYNRQVTKLSLSCRVVDEQQIERHYSNHNLNELYTFEGYDKEKPTLNLPKDRLLAEIFLKFKDIVENYHEHDSLLENKAEEELDEEERKQAWLEYEEEKKGKPLINSMANTALMMNQNNAFLQQCMMMRNSMQPNMMSQNMFEYNSFQQLIRKDVRYEDYPNATPEQQKMMTNRAIVEMYNYWEKQATLYNKQPVQPVQNPFLPNFQQRPQAPNFQQRPQVPVTSNMHPQVTQLGHLLSGQSMNYVNANKSVQLNDTQTGDLIPNLFSKQNTSSNNNIGGTMDQDIIEVVPTTSTGITRQSGMSSVQIAAQPIDNSKIQEE